MKAMIKCSIILAVILASWVSMAKPLTDNEVRKVMIKESISQYSGICPCPYSTLQNGRRCDGRSAYSKPDGTEPLCYMSNISHVMVKRYRARHDYN